MIVSKRDLSPIAAGELILPITEMNLEEDLELQMKMLTAKHPDFSLNRELGYAVPGLTYGTVS